MLSNILDYIANFVYRNNVLKYILTPEGRVIYESGNFSYQYFLKDHLGNTRVVMDENSNVLQANNYYPFGMHRPIQGDATQNYLYNGKEKQEGTDWYDYGARMYDAALGRWHVSDPLANKYYHLSPYQYCANNPLIYVDPDGKKIIYVNGFLGFGSPSGGAAYWNRSFVRGAQNYFHDKSSYYTNFDYNYMTSSTALRTQDGYEYAKQNYSDIISGMDPKKDVFRFVSHSMGGAFSEGMMKYLQEQGWQIETAVHIDAWSPTEMNPDGNMEVIDATVTNDPVQFLSLTLDEDGLNRDIPNSDIKIREKSKKGLSFRHRDLIDSDKLWKELLPNATNQQNNNTSNNSSGQSSWNQAMYTISSWLQQNPNITITVR